MFEKTPEQLFQKAIKHHRSSARGENGLWTNMDHQNALDECDKIFDILREKGDESKPEHHEGEYYFDNLTQKTHWLKGLLLAQHMYGHRGFGGPIIQFKSAMLEFDKAIQINPENKDMWIVKITLFNDWREMKRKEDGGNHPELLAEITKCCDKVLSIDKDRLDAWDDKGLATGQLGRWEDEIECNNNVLRLDNRKEKRIAALGLNSECFKNLGRLSEAEKSLLEIQKIDPYNEMALEGLQKLSLDKVQQQLGKVKKTVEQLRKVVDGGNQIPNDIEIKKINSSSLETSMSCKKCGSTLKPTAKFCGKCGTPIAYNVQI